MPNGIVISTISQVKSVPIVGKFISNIFKAPQTKDGFDKWIKDIYPVINNRGAYYEFANNLPMTASQKAQISGLVMIMCGVPNWTKAQKASLLEHCQNIAVIPDPPPPPPVEVHTVSASYSPQAQTQVVEKSRDVQEVVQAGISGISKIPIYVWLGIGTLLILPQLLKGGKK